MSAISDRLQDALEKGDVAELEVAITAAQSALEDGIYRNGPRSKTSGSLAALLSKAKDVFLNNLEDCKEYLKPLRKACRQLDERVILEALLHTQRAPERVQLCMYTDIRRAEELREGILAAREEAAHLLSSSDWQLIDEFLNERAAMLEDRTVLALVQRREDLLRSESHRASSYSLGKGYGNGGGHEGSGTSAFLARTRSSGGNATDLRASPVEEPYAPALTRRAAPAWRTGVALAAATASPTATPTTRTTTQAAAAKAASPPSLSSAPARRASGPYALRPLIAEESERRAELTTAEAARRVELYKAEMLSAAMGGLDAGLCRLDLLTLPRLRAVVEVATVAGLEEDADSTSTPPEPRTTPPRASASPLEREGGHSSRHGYALSAAHLLMAGDRAAPPPSRSPVRRSRPHDTSPSRGPALAPASAPASRPTGSARGPPKRRVGDDTTPNMSPIRHHSATLLSDRQDAGSTGVGGVGLADLLARPHPAVGVVRGPQTAAPAAEGVVESPGATPSSSRRATVGPTPSTYEARRREILQRSLMDEEELHRRDLEGTEDFDRCVFLHPMAARGEMLRCAVQTRARAMAVL